MKMTGYRLMAFAVAGRRIAYVVFVGTTLVDWQISRRLRGAKRSREEVLTEWIEDFGPDAVVCERLGENSRKGRSAKYSLAVIDAICAKRHVLQASVPRCQSFANKYQEAAALTDQYPELEPWCPRQPKFYEMEPPSALIFEALALAKTVLDDPTATLAQAMG